MKKSKRLFAAFLVLAMCLSLMPTYAFAEENEEEAQIITTEIAEEPVEDGVPDVPGETEEAEGEESEPQSVRVTFVCDPEALVLTVWEEAAKETETSEDPAEPIAAENDGTYLLLPGEYVYTAECEGYESAENVTFTVEETELTLAVTLTVISAEDAETETETVPSAEETTVVSFLSDDLAIVASGECGDDLTWTLDNNGVLTIEGTGAMFDYTASSPAPWHDYSSNICAVSITSGVTGIGSNAFRNCTSLASIYIPAGVTSITASFYKLSPFFGCSAGLTIYCGAESQPAGWGNYYKYQAEYGKSLSVKFGYDEAEYRFFSALDPTAENVVIPDNITRIPQKAFLNNKSIESVTVPETVTVIGDSAFEGCTSLSIVNIPDSVSSVGGSAFKNCSCLQSINIPYGLQNIGAYTFYNCSGLDEITIPDSVETIGFYAFGSCGSITEITVPDSVETIDSYAFSCCDGLETAVIGNGVKTIGDYAFYYSENLADVTLGSGVKTIGVSVFESCALTSAVIPDSIEMIDNYAFVDCTELTSIYVGSGVLKIGDDVFGGCTSLNDLYFNGTEDQWNEIAIGEENACLFDAELHFTDLVSDIAKKAFITRLYEVCLGREPSADDLRYSVEELENGTTGAEKAYMFIFSDEFKAKNYCDRHYTEALYLAFMGRTPTEDELGYYEYLLQQGNTREDVFNIFIQSGEFGEICAEAGIEVGEEISYTGNGTKPGGYCCVEGCTAKDGKVDFATRLYEVCLDREPSQDEIDAWHYYLVHGDHTATSASRYFIFSGEFTGKNYSDEEYTKHLYDAMMGRNGVYSVDELAYWCWMLRDQGLTREAMFDQFAASDEFKAICQQYSVVHS